MLRTHHRRTCGFTMIELLLALAMTAFLLAAAAAAFKASVVNYQENEEIFKTINSARQALFRMTSQLRVAEAVATGEPANQCSFVTASGQNITYQHNSSDNKLYLIDNDAGNSYVLCDNVTALTFTRQTFLDSDSVLRVRYVQISLAVAHGGTERTYSAAVVIRRNLVTAE